MVSLIRNIKLILQQNGNVIWRRESSRKGLNTTPVPNLSLSDLSSQLFDLRAVVNWRSPTAAKSAYYIESATGLGLTTYRGSLPGRLTCPWASERHWSRRYGKTSYRDWATRQAQKVGKRRKGKRKGRGETKDWGEGGEKSPKSLSPPPFLRTPRRLTWG